MSFQSNVTAENQQLQSKLLETRRELEIANLMIHNLKLKLDYIRDQTILCTASDRHGDFHRNVQAVLRQR